MLRLTHAISCSRDAWKTSQEYFEKQLHRGLVSVKLLRVRSAPLECSDEEDYLGLLCVVSLYFLYYFLSIVSLKQWLLSCCCVWPLCQRVEELTDLCPSVCAVTSPPRGVGACTWQWWGRGLEAPVDDNWCISSHSGCCRECNGLWPRKLDPEWGSDLLSVAVLGTAGAQRPKSACSTLLVADLLDLLSFTVKHCGCPLGIPSHVKE